MSLKKAYKACNIMIVLKIISIIFMASNTVSASPQRVAQVDFDLTKVFKLYSFPGRDTTIYFPCTVEYATTGTAEDIKVSLPKKFPNLITVFLLHSKAESTSFKVLCADRVFVFDIVPSKENHIDFLKITNSHGELPRYSDRELHIKKEFNDTHDVLMQRRPSGKVIFSTEKIVKRSGEYE
jgi:hypothetical protein